MSRPVRGRAQGGRAGGSVRVQMGERLCGGCLSRATEGGTGGTAVHACMGIHIRSLLHSAACAASSQPGHRLLL